MWDGCKKKRAGSTTGPIVPASSPMQVVGMAVEEDVFCEACGFEQHLVGTIRL
jgi:hypothetical protein